MKKALIEQILRDTETGYNLVAEKFSETRRHFWRGLEFIGDYAKNGDKILDFGCGNGRLLELISAKVQPSQYIGVDISQKLVNIAKLKYQGENIKFIKISPDQIILPFPDNYFNCVYSVAVFHHLPSHGYRLQIAKELYRVTKTGGHIIITVWNLWPASTRPPRLGEAGGDRSPAPTRNRNESMRGGQKNYLKNILKNWLDKILGKSSLDWNDCYINFKNNEGKIFSRYHHAFTSGELNKLLVKAGFKSKRSEIIGSRNVIFIGRK